MLRAEHNRLDRHRSLPILADSARGATDMTSRADRSTINRALAKAIAYRDCGKPAKAASGAAELVRLLEAH